MMTFPVKRRQRVPSANLGASRHGLNPATVAAMLARQAYLCLICVKPLTLSTAVIDHDHALAALHPHRVERGCPACVRGLICMACNTGLGAFRDDPTAMRRAANYIEEARR